MDAIDLKNLKFIIQFVFQRTAKGQIDEAQILNLLKQ